MVIVVIVVGADAAKRLFLIRLCLPNRIPTGVSNKRFNPHKQSRITHNHRQRSAGVKKRARWVEAATGMIVTEDILRVAKQAK